jgi:uncharacterized membrane protein
MQSTLRNFSDWLAGTSLSEVIQTVSWVIPAIQTIHIVSIAIVVTATFLVSLRVLGVFDTSEPIAALSRRFLSWVWYALLVLFVSGALLVIGEPGRSLMNPVFALKMVMLVVVAVLTLVLQRPLATEAGYWEASARRRLVARGIAVVSLVLWSSIVFAGRWIAYVESF